MPNGKPGDHPFTDTVVRGLEAYSPAADSLVREIARLAPEPERRGLGRRPRGAATRSSGGGVAPVIPSSGRSRSP